MYVCTYVAMYTCKYIHTSKEARVRLIEKCYHKIAKCTYAHIYVRMSKEPVNSHVAIQSLYSVAK